VVGGEEEGRRDKGGVAERGRRGGVWGEVGVGGERGGCGGSRCAELEGSVGSVWVPERCWRV